MSKVPLSVCCTILVIFSLMFLNSGCTLPVSGGGTEGGNTVCGVFFDETENTSVNAIVLLLPSDFNPGISDLNTYVRSTMTEEDGSYVFDNAAAGEYSIQAEDLQGIKRTLITGITVSDTDIEVPVDTLKNPGVMMVELPETGGGETGYIYIPGTTIHITFSDTAKYVVINNVPAKDLPPICLGKHRDSSTNVLRYNVEIDPDDTVVVKNTQWMYSRRLYLNTTQSGAGVNETVHNFPVVVRLNRSNFDFSQTRMDGADFHFVRSDSVPLSHEVERWDAAMGQGEIWINVDTIFGNNNTQFIMMYWGNPDPIYRLERGAVFDTASGFQGVWHLGGSDDTLFDATPNRFHGIRNGNLTMTSGMVGNGQLFQDSGAFIEMGNVLNTNYSDLTLSAWVKRSGNGLQTIMAKSEGGDPGSEYGWTLSFHTADQLHFFSASGGEDWGDSGVFDCWSEEESPVDDTTEWHFLTVVFDRSDNQECLLYIDGVEMSGGASGDIAEVEALVNNAPFRIGAEADGDYPWTGYIDECVVAHTIRKESWIKLCFSNQGPEDKLIQHVH